MLVVLTADWLNGSVDWKTILYPQVPLLETFARGTLVYLGLFLMLRFLAKREVGALSLTDLLLLVLLADAAQNAMAANYRSVTDGLLLIATIIAWSTLLNFLGYRYEKIKKITKPPKLLLVKNGRFIEKNLKKEFITKSELMGEIRAQGIKYIKYVDEAYIESDGIISVIRKGDSGNSGHNKKKRV